MKRFYRQFSSLLFCGWLLLPQIAATQTVFLSSNIEPVDPTASISYLLDSEDILILEDVRNREFTPLENDSIDFGFTADKIWMRFSVHNSSAESINPLLRSSARFMRPLEIFILRENGSVEQLLYNDETQAFGERPLPELRFLATEFNLAPNEEAEFYIRFGAGGQASMTLEISSREDALSEQWRASVGLVVFSTILLTLVLVNFFHFIAVRNLAYLVYVFYESFNVIYVAHMEGFTFQYLWPNLPQWNDDATPIIASLGLIIGNFFAMVFLEAKKHAPLIHKIFLTFIAISALILLMTLLAGNRLGNQLTAPMLPISIILSVIAAVAAIRNGHYLARYFLVAWAMFGVSAAIWSGTILGLFTADYNILTIYKSTIAIQAIILSMGLADQVRRINNEFTSTQAELISSLEARLEDTRERFRLERKNEEAMDRLSAKSKQLATTSHDINQPIQSLRLALKSLQSKSSDYSTEQLEKTLDHMESILGGALDKASDELKESSEQAPVQSLVAGSLLSEIANHFQDQANENAIALKCFNSNAVIVSRDLPLKRCLMNLVANALSHGSADKILLGARRRGEHLLFQVVDTGKGIPQEQIEKLQHPLNKGIDSKGHGLGLAIIREICSEYGWKFSINSVLGKGSCFTISVPVRA